MEPLDGAPEVRLLERLLAIPATEPEKAMSAAAEVVAEVFSADKVDVFVFEASRNSLVAIGTSYQPLSALQKQLGLDVLPISNGGRVVQVFETGQSFLSGRLDTDMEELRGIRVGMRIKTKLGVPLVVAGETRGVLMLASLAHDRWTEQDRPLAEKAGGWVSRLLEKTDTIGGMLRTASEQGRTAAEELLTVLAHDFRNHLTPVQLRLALSLQSLESAGNEPEARRLRQTLASIARLAALVNDLLDVARLDRGVFEIQAQELVEMPALVREVAAVLATTEHVIEVRVRSTGRLGVWADASRLRQVLENLLSNAVKHSPPRAPVVVEVDEVVTTGGRVVSVEVIDQGPGVPAHLIGRVFDRFVSGETAGGGLGLGLYLARRIARLHDGELEVENLPDRGARFRLTLPASRAAGKALELH